MKGDRRMTIREVLARVDTIRPNAYTDGEKIAMLNTIEGRIYTDILEQAEGFDKEFLPWFPFLLQMYTSIIWRL